MYEDDDIDLENAPHCLDQHRWILNEGYEGPGALYTCRRCPAAYLDESQMPETGQQGTGLLGSG